MLGVVNEPRLALSIRQPYAELILRGIKTVELRNRATKIVGERFYIYAAKARATVPIWSDDLQVGSPPAWMAELARQVGMIGPGEELLTGLIVGSAKIERIIEPTAPGDVFQWVLCDVRREPTPWRPTRHPQPTWWRAN
jgi:hypothetical protein